MSLLQKRKNKTEPDTVSWVVRAFSPCSALDWRPAGSRTLSPCVVGCGALLAHTSLDVLFCKQIERPRLGLGRRGGGSYFWAFPGVS